MHSRFHALSPDDSDLRPSLPFVQDVHGTNDVEDVSVTKLLNRTNQQKAAVKEGKMKLFAGFMSSTGTGGGSSTGVRSSTTEPDFMTQLRRFSLVGGGLTQEEINNSMAEADAKAASAEVIPTNFHGYLFKKANDKGKAAMQYVRVDPWKKRWFVLDKGRLFYYYSEEDWKHGRSPRNEANPILMGAFEVMVNPKDLEWGFLLQSVGGEERNWQMRAESENLRLAWVKILLRASLIGGSDTTSEFVDAETTKNHLDDETTNVL